MAVPVRKIADGVTSLAQKLGNFIEHILRDEANFSSLADGLKAVDAKAWTPVLKSRVDRAVRIQVRRVCRPYARFENVQLTLRTLRTCERYVLEVDEHASMRMAAYADLVEDALAERRDFGAERVLRMKHVPEILKIVRQSSRLDRAELQSRFSLGEANLSRVLNAMEAAGFIERAAVGRTVEIRLPRSGRPALPKPTSTIAAPSIVSGSSGKWTFYVQPDGSPFSQAVTYAREMGADRDVGIEIKEIEDDSKFGNDVDARTGVLRASASRSSAGWVPHYIYGTHLGGELIAIGRQSNSTHTTTSAGSLQRVAELTKLLSAGQKFTLCLGDSDPQAQEFARRILFALAHSPGKPPRFGNAGRDLCEPYSPGDTNALFVYWAGLSTPLQNQALSLHRLASVRWLDLEAAAEREESLKIGSGAAEIREALRSAANHWTLSTRAAVSPSQIESVAFRELLGRIYWLGASTAEAIRADRGSYLSFVKTKQGPPSVDSDFVFSFDGDRVRMPDSSDYLTSASADRYYWEALGAHKDDCLNLHLRETGELRDSYLIQLHGRRSRKRPQEKQAAPKSKGS